MLQMIEKAQQNQLKKLKSLVNFKTMLARDSAPCRSQNAIDSHESRFELLKGNVELLSRYRNTRKAAEIG